MDEVAALCQPDAVYWCDGSQEEYDRLMAQMVGTAWANPLKQRPNSFLFRSDPSDVARVEARTYISTPNKDDAGPTNNWVAPDELKKTMLGLYDGCMRGRTLYVIPFSMGPRRLAHVQGRRRDHRQPLRRLQHAHHDPRRHQGRRGAGRRWRVRPLPALGRRAARARARRTCQWPCAPMEQKYISHFPDENLIWSYGSGYGGNALLGKKCLALRIASAMAHREGWMAEHMLILRLISPEGKRYHIAAAFPSACGKTNLAMIQPTIPGWKAEMHRRRHRLDEDRAGWPAVCHQPGGGLFRRRAGHLVRVQPDGHGHGPRKTSSSPTAR